MKIVNVESFLRFWSHYNTLIIEVLIGLILLMVVYLAFRSFFGEEDEPVRVAAGHTPKGGDHSRDHKSAVSAAPVHEEPAAPVSAPASSAAPAPAPVTEAPPSNAGQDQNIKDLQAKLSDSEKRLAETLASMNALKEAAASSATAEAPKESAQASSSPELEEKIKSLEARLAEYEIIAEDIADLSFYKEENTKLQKEIETLRPSPTGAKAAPVAADPEPSEPESPPAPEALAEPVPEVETAPAVVEETPAAVAELAPLPDPEPEVQAPSTPSGEKPLSEADDAELMDKFQNFVKKG